MKAIFKVTAVAALMAAGLSSAMAATQGNDATINLKGKVTLVSCQLGPSIDGVGVQDIDFGNWAQSDFSQKSTPAQGLPQGLNLVPTNKTFGISMSNCSSGQATDTGHGVELTMVNTPNEIDSTNHIFGDQGGAGHSSNAGFVISYTSPAQATPEQVVPGTPVKVYNFVSGDTWASINGKQASFTAWMASTNSTPDTGDVSTQLVFTADYQ
jgi:type 1 fimbria pilin